MKRDIYLLWSPQGWGVFSECSCPDPHDLPDYWYKKYTFEEDLFEHKTYDKIFEGLMDKMLLLRKNKVIPDIENYNDIFPELSDLLE